MPRCTFCGMDIPRGTGKMFVFSTGKIMYFCSRKCDKNMLKLKRNPSLTRWTQFSRQARGKK